MSQPKDYDQTDPNYKQYYHGGIAVSGKGGGGRDKRLDLWLQGLVLAGIVSLVGIVWTLRNEVTKISAYLTAKVEQNDRDIARIDRTIDRHDQRITTLEQGGRAGNGQSYYRQER